MFNTDFSRGRRKLPVSVLMSVSTSSISDWLEFSSFQLFGSQHHVTLLVYHAEGCCKHSDPEIVGTVRVTYTCQLLKTTKKLYASMNEGHYLYWTSEWREIKMFDAGDFDTENTHNLFGLVADLCQNSFGNWVITWRFFFLYSELCI